MNTLKLLAKVLVPDSSPTKVFDRPGPLFLPELAPMKVLLFAGLALAPLDRAPAKLPKNVLAESETMLMPELSPYMALKAPEIKLPPAPIPVKVLFVLE